MMSIENRAVIQAGPTANMPPGTAARVPIPTGCKRLIADIFLSGTIDNNPPGAVTGTDLEFDILMTSFCASIQ